MGWVGRKRKGIGGNGSKMEGDGTEVDAIDRSLKGDMLRDGILRTVPR